MIFNRIKHYRVYRRLVLSYVLLVTVTVFVVCAILYALFSSRAVQEIDRSSREMLSQVSYTADVVYTQIHDISYQLLNDNRIVSFMYAKESNKQIDYNASLLLTAVQSIYPFIADISLYNFENGAYIDTAGLPPQRFEAEERSNQGGYLAFYPRKAELANREPLHLLTFRFFPEHSLSESPQSAIVLDLRESYIQNTMSRIGASLRDASNFVMSSEGVVLSHSNPAYFMENFRDRDYVQDILESGEPQGSFVRSIDGRKQLVAYVKSDTIDWYFVSVRPYDQLLSNLYELRNWTLLIGLTLIVAGAALSLLLTGNIYNPIKTLVDRVSERRSEDAKRSLLRLDEYQLLSEAFEHNEASERTLKSTLSRSSQALKNSYLQHLIKGNRTDYAVPAEIEREWRERLRGPYFAVVLLNIDGAAAFRQKYNAFDRGLIRFAIGNIALEQLSASFIADRVAAEDDETAFILQSDRAALGDRIYLVLSEVQDTIRRFYGLSVSASIGDMTSSLDDVHVSYQTARSYMNNRFFYGPGSVLDASKAPDADRAPAKYPGNLEKSLLEDVKLGNRKAIEGDVAAWIAFIASANYEQAMQYTTFLLHAVIREFEPILDVWSIDPNELYRDLDAVQRVETVDDLEQLLLGFCNRIVTIAEESRNNAAAVKNEQLIEDVKRFLEERHADPTLSLELAAEKAGLSSGYLGKLFKSVTGATFNEYVTHIRMERAKTLLIETQDTVAQIGEKVGIYNVPYFTTLFKKKFGITPTQFREHGRKT
ncbi:AraC family transcriptional regulator [Paenibacillus sp.]|uniref:AraC family transcriptional regulator n=1 Tax=Paenibacillus sp. TaxID=58172 RepID=UPI002D2D7FE2|nr:AraC family transcriptional regulator [Paenibacillus sp.]HZG84137.1 AraC family transcriptional regulator [Paenibacillus sp.]